MTKFESKAHKVCKALLNVANIFIMLQMLFIVLNIILRQFFNSPIIGSTEIVRYTSLISAAFALAENEWLGGNIRVTMVLEVISARLRNAVSFMADIIMTSGLAFVFYYMVKQAVKYYIQKDVTLELFMPTWIFATVLAAGLLAFTLCSLSKTIIAGYCLFTGKKRKSPVADT